MNLFKKLIKPQIPELELTKYPDFTNIRQWIDIKTSYYAKYKPELLETLFNPSSRDYLPLSIALGTSKEHFDEYLEYYRRVKRRYPEAVENAKKSYVHYMRYRYGDPEDYIGYYF